MDSVEQLDEFMTRPGPELVQWARGLDGDLLILGVGGKMGPSLAQLALRASREAGVERRVIGVSRFSDPELEKALQAKGVETIRADLSNPDDLARLPDVRNVVFMAGRKFGTTGNQALTWAMNVFMPGLVAQRFRNSRIVAFSTGNVYPLVPVTSGGATEDTRPDPVGEYAQSTLGRERVFEHFSGVNGTPVTLIRLNYAIDLRYGVLLDVAQKVLDGEPISVEMPAVNVIWQGDANAYVLRAFDLATSPPAVLNVTGPETVSIRWLATRFGEIFGKQPVFTGEEQPTAYLSNASRCFELFGYPRVPLLYMIRWVAHWLKTGGPTLAKPTHFDERKGQY
ncbi:MAG TPA: NAD(P)-dependent oxidoreductase [Bacteroidetes bacterium]|nr:NAD(P)-dependent oxidoreductase [Bacteroidota bacterium]